jgi:hypothetical protein
MRPCKAHFVTSCQQLLALGAVLAVLTPAASVVSLDVVHTPGSAAAGDPRGHDHRHDRPAADGLPGAPRTGHEASEAATVPVAPVEPVVTEVAMTTEQDGSGRGDVAADTEELTRTTVLSEPQPVTGYGAVGVTWSHDEQVADDRIALEVRTATDGAWSTWSELEYHDEHAPDPATEEGRDTRPGTDPLFVGEVDQVQLRAVAEDGLPDDMSLAVVAPGRASDVARQAPGVDAEGADEDADPGASEEAIELQAATTTAPRPKIYTREQWGADERLRDGRPSYGSISAGFVHHTVNANDYSRGDVPGIIRSIYAYHTRSRGWSDIGYNFVVDKFGRIWEGRYGGVARPVIGAHTLGYNEDSFAMSAIGNYETARPSEAMLKAYGALFAWKLGLEGIDPMDRSQNVSGDTFRAINGHRDAGSTACPGRHLYAQLPDIRSYAEAATEPEPEPVTLRQVDSDLAGSRYPDLVVRRAADGRGMVLPTGGLTGFDAPVTLARSGWGRRTFLATPDLTGDGRGDVVTFDDSGSLEVRPGPAADGYRTVVRTARGFRGHDLVATAGDLDGDGRVDFVARAQGSLVSFLRTERGGFRRQSQETSLRGYQQLVGAADVTGDGRPDLWGRDGSGRLWLHSGLGGGRFADRVRVTTAYDDVEWLVGGVDYTGDSVADLVVRRANGTLLVLPAAGDGTLGRALGPVADVDGLRRLSGAGQLTDGTAPDLLAARSDGALVALPNRGTFDLGAPIDTRQSFARGDRLLNAGDFDGDGDGDVILRRKIGSVWLYRGRGTGRLADPVWIGGKRPFGKVAGLRVVADVTGDDRNDVVGRIDGETMVWPGAGADRLQKRTPIEVAAATTSGTGGSAYDWRVATSDLRGHGRADLVVRDGDGALFRLDGTRDGYGAPRYLGEAGGYDLAG